MFCNSDGAHSHTIQNVMLMISSTFLHARQYFNPLYLSVSIFRCSLSNLCIKQSYGSPVFYKWAQRTIHVVRKWMFVAVLPISRPLWHFISHPAISLLKLPCLHFLYVTLALLDPSTTQALESVRQNVLLPVSCFMQMCAHIFLTMSIAILLIRSDSTLQLLQSINLIFASDKLDASTNSFSFSFGMYRKKAWYTNSE